MNWSFSNFIRPVNGDHWFKWVWVESKVLSPSLSLCWRSVSTAVVALRQWRFSELDERKIHSLVYSVWSRIENSVEGMVGVEANAGVKQSLEPRYMGSIPGKLMFRHSEASHIAEALTVGLELCLDNDSEAPQVVRCGLVTSVLAPQCSKGPRQPMLSQKSGTPRSDARCRPVFWTLKFFFLMWTHFQLTHGLGVHDIHSVHATCDLSELDGIQTGLHSL